MFTTTAEAPAAATTGRASGGDARATTPQHATYTVRNHSGAAATSRCTTPMATARSALTHSRWERVGERNGAPGCRGFHATAAVPGRFTVELRSTPPASGTPAPSSSAADDLEDEQTSIASDASFGGGASTRHRGAPNIVSDCSGGLHTPALREEGTIYSFGGEHPAVDARTDDVLFNDVCEYTSSSHAWKPIPRSTNGPLPAKRKGHSLTFVPTLHALVLFGGVSTMSQGKRHTTLEQSNFDGSYFNDVWLLDLAAGHWTELSNDIASDTTPEPRAFHTTTLFYENKLLVFGGYGCHEDKAVWVLDLRRLVWYQLPCRVEASAKELIKRRFGHVACNFNESLYVWGGQLKSRDCTGEVIKLEVAPTLTVGQWSAVGRGSPEARSFAGSALLEGRWIIAGGISVSPMTRVYSEVWEFHLRQEKWRIISTLALPMPLQGLTLNTLVGELTTSLVTCGGIGADGIANEQSYSLAFINSSTPARRIEDAVLPTPCRQVFWELLLDWNQGSEVARLKKRVSHLMKQKRMWLTERTEIQAQATEAAELAQVTTAQLQELQRENQTLSAYVQDLERFKHEHEETAKVAEDALEAIRVLQSEKAELAMTMGEMSDRLTGLLHLVQQRDRANEEQQRVIQHQNAQLVESQRAAAAAAAEGRAARERLEEAARHATDLQARFAALNADLDGARNALQGERSARAKLTVTLAEREAHLQETAALAKRSREATETLELELEELRNRTDESEQERLEVVAKIKLQEEELEKLKTDADQLRQEKHKVDENALEAARHMELLSASLEAEKQHAAKTAVDLSIMKVKAADMQEALQAEMDKTAGLRVELESAQQRLAQVTEDRNIAQAESNEKTKRLQSLAAEVYNERSQKAQQITALETKVQEKDRLLAETRAEKQCELGSLKQEVAQLKNELQRNHAVIIDIHAQKNGEAEAYQSKLKALQEKCDEAYACLNETARYLRAAGTRGEFQRRTIIRVLLSVADDGRVTPSDSGQEDNTEEGSNNDLLFNTPIRPRPGLLRSITDLAISPSVKGSSPQEQLFPNVKLDHSSKLVLRHNRRVATEHVRQITLGTGYDASTVHSHRHPLSNKEPLASNYQPPVSTVMLLGEGDVVTDQPSKRNKYSGRGGSSRWRSVPRWGSSRRELIHLLMANEDWMTESSKVDNYFKQLADDFIGTLTHSLQARFGENFLNKAAATLPSDYPCQPATTVAVAATTTASESTATEAIVTRCNSARPTSQVLTADSCHAEPFGDSPTEHISGDRLSLGDALPQLLPAATESLNANYRSTLLDGTPVKQSATGSRFSFGRGVPSDSGSENDSLVNSCRGSNGRAEQANVLNEDDELTFTAELPVKPNSSNTTTSTTKNGAPLSANKTAEEQTAAAVSAAASPIATRGASAGSPGVRYPLPKGRKDTGAIGVGSTKLPSFMARRGDKGGPPEQQQRAAAERRAATTGAETRTTTAAAAYTSPDKQSSTVGTRNGRAVKPALDTASKMTPSYPRQTVAGRFASRQFGTKV